MARDDDLKEQIRAHGLRATASRVAVLRFVYGHAPSSHPEVSDALAEWDRSTLYRNLVDLADAGLLRRVDLGDRVWRFERVDAEHADDHPHFLCTECGEVSCLPTIPLPKGHVPAAVASGRVSIQLRGVCDACAG